MYSGNSTTTVRSCCDLDSIVYCDSIVSALKYRDTYRIGQWLYQPTSTSNIVVKKVHVQ